MRTKTLAQTQIKLFPNHPDLSAIQWVSQATSKYKDRIVLTHLLIEDGKCIATDGRRLHITKTKAIYTNGQYEIIKNTKTGFYAKKIDTKEVYPNYKQVIPEWNKEKSKVVETIQIGKTEEPTYRKELTGRNLFKIATQFYNYNQEWYEEYNLNYLIEAISPDQKWYAYQKDLHDPVRIQNSTELEEWTRMAIVMPIVKN